MKKILAMLIIIGFVFAINGIALADEAEVIVTVTAYSADGNYSALGYSDGKLELYDGKTGVLLHIRAHNGAVSSMDFSTADNSLIITAGANVFWYNSSFNLITSWPLLDARNAIFNGPEQLIIQRDGLISVWVIGDLGWMYIAEGAKPNAIAVNGKESAGLVAIAFDNGEIHVLTPSGELLTSFQGSWGDTKQLLFNGDDILVVTNQQVLKFEENLNGEYDLAWNLLAYSGDVIGRIDQWNIGKFDEGEIITGAALGGEEGSYVTIVTNQGRILKMSVGSGSFVFEHHYGGSLLVDSNDAGDTLLVEHTGEIHQWFTTLKMCRWSPAFGEIRTAVTPREEACPFGWWNQ